MIVIGCLALSGIVLAAGVIAFFRGAWGTAVGPHPRCRKCSYDLFGLPAQSSRCPECGADLGGPRAVLTRGRIRRWRPAVRGIAVAAFGAVGLAGNLAYMRDPDIEHYKPFWLLLRDLKAGGNREVAATRELERRIANESLAPRQLRSLVEATMGASLTAGVRMVDAGPALRLTCFPGSRWARYDSVYFSITAIDLDGVPLPPPDEERSMSIHPGCGCVSGNPKFHMPLQAPPSPGSHTVRCAVSYHFLAIGARGHLSASATFTVSP